MPQVGASLRPPFRVAPFRGSDLCNCLWLRRLWFHFVAEFRGCISWLIPWLAGSVPHGSGSPLCGFPFLALGP